MNCKNPLIVPNPAWFPGSSEPRGFKVPCGKCLSCRIARRGEWVVRLICEFESWKPHASFITLTYSDENLPPDGSLLKSDLQKFFKRLRKVKDIKYFACGEYGDHTFRPHYHAIVFGLDYMEGRKLLPTLWTKGRTSSDSVTMDSIRYVAGYVEKKLYGNDAKETYEIVGSRPTKEGRATPVFRKLPPFSLTSLGIGKEWCLAHRERLLRDNGVKYQGKFLGFPRYFRKVLGIDKLYMYEIAQEKEKEVDERLIAQGIDPDFLGNYKLEACKHYDVELHQKHSLFKGRNKI